jgi:hypothetical protein
MLADVGGQCAAGRRVVSTVEKQVGVAPYDLDSPGPDRPLEPASDREGVDGSEIPTAELLREKHCGRGVVCLMAASQSESQVIVSTGRGSERHDGRIRESVGASRGPDIAVGRVDERRAGSDRLSLDDLQNLGKLTADHRGDVAPQDPGLLVSDLRKRTPEPLHVIHRDGRDRGG